MAFSAFAGPISNLSPAGAFDCETLLCATREGAHPLLGDWRDPLPAGKEARKREQRRRPYCTPNAVVRWRNTAGFDAWSDCLFADLDDVDDACAVRDLVASMSTCLCAWVSGSGRGVHALHKCEGRESIDDHKAAWAHLRGRLLALELGCVVDECAGTPTQPLFVAYDPDAREGSGAESLSIAQVRVEIPIVDFPPTAVVVSASNRAGLTRTETLEEVRPGQRANALKQALLRVLGLPSYQKAPVGQTIKEALRLNATMPVPLTQAEAIRHAEGLWRWQQGHIGESRRTHSEVTRDPNPSKKTGEWLSAIWDDRGAYRRYRELPMKRILRHLNDGLSLGRIAKITDVPKSTIHRIAVKHRSQ